MGASCLVGLDCVGHRIPWNAFNEPRSHYRTVLAWPEEEGMRGHRHKKAETDPRRLPVMRSFCQCLGTSLEGR